MFASEILSLVLVTVLEKYNTALKKKQKHNIATKMIKDMKLLYKKRLQYLRYFSFKKGDEIWLKHIKLYIELGEEQIMLFYIKPEIELRSWIL